MDDPALALYLTELSHNATEVKTLVNLLRHQGEHSSGARMKLLPSSSIHSLILGQRGIIAEIMSEERPHHE
jgi:hypothetical protein